MLINTGRGPLVDEAALIDALRNEPVGAAGLDVCEFERRVTPGLLQLYNVVLLPHIGSATRECRTGCRPTGKLDRSQTGRAPDYSEQQSEHHDTT